VSDTHPGAVIFLIPYLLAAGPVNFLILWAGKKKTSFARAEAWYFLAPFVLWSVSFSVFEKKYSCGLCLVPGEFIIEFMAVVVVGGLTLAPRAAMAALGSSATHRVSLFTAITAGLLLAALHAGM